MFHGIRLLACGRITPALGRSVASIGLALALTAGASTSGAVSRVHDFNATLQAGVWHGWALQPACANRGLVADITPTSAGTNGLTLARTVIQPEYNGAEWNDVLRAQTPPGSPALNVNVKTFDTSGLPIHAQFTTTLQPGAWTGFLLGASSQNRGYLPEVTPTGGAANGATLQRVVVQPEYNGTTWNDVLRVQIPSSAAALPVSIRVYTTGSSPVVSSFTATLQPGAWQGYLIGASSLERALLAEVTPTSGSSDGATLQNAVIQPEYDGTQWNDVLRLQIPGGLAALPVQVRVYALQAPAVAPPVVAAVADAAPDAACRAASLGPGEPMVTAAGLPAHPLAVWYAVPSGITPDPAVLARIKRATADIQAWYQCATGGRTWTFAFPETVRVYQAAHDRSYYSTHDNWWGSLLPEMQSGGLPVWSPGTIGAVWAHGAGWWAGAAQSCGGQCGMALLGVELFPEFNNPAWSGGACPGGQGGNAWPCTPEGAYAHELGHTLGLPHPVDVPMRQPVANHSVMQTHWNYPDWAAGSSRPWGLLTHEREVVRASPFMHDRVALVQTHEDCDLVNLPDRCTAPDAAFVAQTSGEPSSFAAVSTSIGAQSLYWTFGDGTTASTATVTHPYATEGQYRVRLRALGAFATMDTASTEFRWVTTAANGPGGARELALAPCSPNPFRRSTALAFRLTGGSVVDLGLFSADGRRVRTLASGFRRAGEWRAAWDGLDTRGRAVPPGVYLVRLRAGGSSLVQRVVRLE